MWIYRINEEALPSAVQMSTEDRNIATYLRSPVVYHTFSSLFTPRLCVPHHGRLLRRGREDYLSSGLADLEGKKENHQEDGLRLGNNQ